MDFESQGVSNEAYITIAKGTTLPDVADIATTIAHTTFNELTIEFELGEGTEVSIGIVANFINDLQWFRARGVILLKYESVFE